jgi:hypothetical protein
MYVYTLVYWLGIHWAWDGTPVYKTRQTHIYTHTNTHIYTQKHTYIAELYVCIMIAPKSTHRKTDFIYASGALFMRNRCMYGHVLHVNEIQSRMCVSSFCVYTRCLSACVSVYLSIGYETEDGSWLRSFCVYTRFLHPQTHTHTHTHIMNSPLTLSCFTYLARLFFVSSSAGFVST